MSGIPLSLQSRSRLPGLAFPSIPGMEVLPLHAVLLQLEQSQWLPPQHLQALQERQMEALLDHVRETVPWYHGRLQAAGLDSGAPFDWAAWQALPLLTRRDIQDAGNALHSRRVPKEHGAIQCHRTSGSTGEPVAVLRTGLDQLMWKAVTLRDHAWHQRDLSATLCAIRAGVSATAEGEWQSDWGPTVTGLFDTGPCAVLPIDTDVGKMVHWLTSRDPHYLLIYPTVLGEVLRRLSSCHLTLPRLREVRTIGEVLPDATRELCNAVLGVPIVDLYSSSEVGNIALQCPRSGLYHVQAESLLVEILRADGSPCSAGEVGRVVVTTLHGFAMPLLRYELRDYAEVAAPCPCGRGLPTLRRIQGRVRNMLHTPEGEVRWPLVGFAEYREVAPVLQYQLAQLAMDHVELRLVTERPLEANEEAALKGIVLKNLGAIPHITLRRVAELPLGPNGKFEEFVSLLMA